MAWTERYANFDLTTGTNAGTSEVNAWQTFAAMAAGVAAGNRVNIKRQAVAYDNTSAITCSVAGTALAPIYFRGYTTTIGDGGLWEVALNTGSLANVTFSGAYTFVEGIKYVGGAIPNSGSLFVSGANSWLIRCYVTVFNTTISYLNMHRCHIRLTGFSLLSIGGTNSFNACWSRNKIERIGNSGQTQIISSDIYGQAVQFLDNLVIGVGTAGEDGLLIQRPGNSRGFVIKGCRFYNVNNGINVVVEPDAVREDGQILDNIFSTLAGYGVLRAATETGYTRLAGNLYHACTSGFTNYSQEAQAFGNTSLSAAPFVSSSNFDLNETAGGGATARAQGFRVTDPYDFSAILDRRVYEGPSPAEVATAVWTTPGRSIS